MTCPGQPMRARAIPGEHDMAFSDRTDKPSNDERPVSKPATHAHAKPRPSEPPARPAHYSDWASI